MILYHGSREIVEGPMYGKGQTNNDYGQGFYCTEVSELAKEWACPEIADGFSNRYELDATGLSVLRLNSGAYHILNWIALLQYRIFPKKTPMARMAQDYIAREFRPDIAGYDVICGYRADDSYFAYARDFLNNTISVSQLALAMKLGELGEQVVLKTPRAFEQIRFLDYEIADACIYYPRRMERESQAQQAYLQNHDRDFDIYGDDLYVRDILRQEVKNDDPRLR